MDTLGEGSMTFFDNPLDRRLPSALRGHVNEQPRKTVTNRSNAKVAVNEIRTEIFVLLRDESSEWMQRIEAPGKPLNLHLFTMALAHLYYTRFARNQARIVESGISALRLP